MQTMHPILSVAIRAAERAGGLIAKRLQQRDQLVVETKSHNDFVSEVDRQAEADIIQTIQKFYPDHAILGEESGSLGKHREFEWIIDPLDGTTNFLHGLPHFSVSIAVLHRGKLAHAVVYDPIRQELFSASRGGGAQMNNRRIRVTTQRTLNHSLLATGFPFRDFSYLDTYMDTFKAFVTQTSGIRRAGSAALDLAWVAAGRVDGFWEFNLSPWDIDAGALIVQEAGGVVCDFAGGENFLKSGNIVASNPKLLAQMMKTLAPQLPEAYRR
jgi:myo-inositol-1(or 4)-monophosphatase